MENFVHSLHEYVIKKDIINISRIERQINLKTFFDENKNHSFLAMKYYGLKNDKNLLEKYILFNELKDISELENAQINHYKGILYILNRNIEKARIYFEESFNYLDTHREKIMINNINYGRDYKGMVMSDLATTYLRMGMLSKARTLYERAYVIFYYKTNNINRSHSCSLGLGTIALRLHNIWEAKVYFQNIKRAKVPHLHIKVSMNLAFTYYLLRDYKNARKNIQDVMKKYEEIPEDSKVYILLTDALVKSASGNIIEVKNKFNIINKLINKIDDQKLKNIYALQKIIAFKSNEEYHIKIIQNELLPYFILNNHVQYIAQAMEYIEKIRGENI